MGAAYSNTARPQMDKENLFTEPRVEEAASFAVRSPQCPPALKKGGTEVTAREWEEGREGFRGGGGPGHTGGRGAGQGGALDPSRELLV